MSFETFDFNLKKIKEQLETYNGTDEKLTYLAYIRKELKRVIRCFESNRFIRYRTTSDDCRERDEYYQKQFNFFSRLYGINDDRTEEGVNERAEERTEELKDCLLNIEDEIEYYKEFGENKKLLKNNPAKPSEENSKNFTVMPKKIKGAKPSGCKEVPARGLKKIAKEACETLIKNNDIKKALQEKKSDKCISSKVIPEIEKNYKLTSANKRSISDYFRKGELLIKEQKDSIVVKDTYPRKGKK